MGSSKTARSNTVTLISLTNVEKLVSGQVPDMTNAAPITVSTDYRSASAWVKTSIMVIAWQTSRMDYRLADGFALSAAFIGLGYGSTFGDDVVAFICLLVGAFLGAMVEHILFRVLVIALFLIMILARQLFWDAVTDAFAVNVSSPNAHYVHQQAPSTNALELPPYLFLIAGDDTHA